MVGSLLIIFLTIFLAIVFIVVVAFILQRVMIDCRFSPKRAQSSHSPRYPKLRDELLRQLETIEPSKDSGIEYRPSLVTLFDGKKVDCVYVVDEQSYFKPWGVWPEDDIGKQFIQIQDVAKIEESPSRLPPKIANELYQAGESGMGYCRFTLVFSDETEQLYITGNAVDFVPLPAGKSRSDIVRVLPHTRTGKNYRQGLKYYWCLYSI